MDLNKELFNEPGLKEKGIKKSFLQIARIPIALILKWKVEEGIEVFNPQHKKAVMRKLHDPEYRYLRTVSGRY